MSIQESQIDMFDLPTESQLLGQATLEANEQAKSMTPEFESATFFPFWKPTGPQSAAVKLGDKSGVVKPKVDFNPSETRMDKVWEDFLAGKKAHDKKNAKPVTEVDAFGSVVLDSFAQKPNPKELVGSIKALKRVATKKLSGKAHSKTETLGVAEFLQSVEPKTPNKNHLVGIVSPKAAMGKQNIPDLLKGGKPKVNDVSGATTTVLKSFDSKLKASENNVEGYGQAGSPGLPLCRQAEAQRCQRHGHHAQVLRRQAQGYPERCRNQVRRGKARQGRPHGNRLPEVRTERRQEGVQAD